jgi:hypothetical protein
MSPGRPSFAWVSAFFRQSFINSCAALKQSARNDLFGSFPDWLILE